MEIPDIVSYCIPDLRNLLWHDLERFVKTAELDDVTNTIVNSVCETISAHGLSGAALTESVPALLAAAHQEVLTLFRREASNDHLRTLGATEQEISELSIQH